MSGRAIAWAVAAACLGVLAGLRAGDGSSREALLLAGTALVAAVLAVTRGRVPAAAPPAAREPDGPESAAIRRTHEVYRVRLRGWRACAVVGLGAAAAGLALFPPLALVAAPVVVVALLRVRRYAHDTQVLARARRAVPSAAGSMKG
ncbi:hypothetical protein [Pseudonocardia sp. MH-G8]|uniref:hypothetical protein n=1 Tax=Pseudonocardia sp. MH-G8 TaxID=1854588 RepID=UPI000B9FC2E9|nr:hypothetical protein [Pseudonocardia sp. MH-G8]OZM78781.1 hypothetical protein CFP66_29535 [Pseudonocardia sp. MH-G8]